MSLRFFKEEGLTRHPGAGSWVLCVGLVLTGVVTAEPALADTAVRVSDINPAPASSGSLYPTFVFNGKFPFRPRSRRRSEEAEGRPPCPPSRNGGWRGSP